jgi:hypothetical protein
MKKHYYLIYDEIFIGDDMPLHIYSDSPVWHTSKMYLNSKDYIDWKESLKECIVTKSELDKILNYLYYDKEMLLDGSLIDISDIVEEAYDLVSKYPDNIKKIFFKNPKQSDSNDNFVYSINSKELIAELDKWMEKCDVMIKEFSEVGMENSMLSSMAMKTAYSNVKQLILEKIK